MASKAKDAVQAKPNANPDEVAACFTEYSSLRADVSRVQQKIAAMFGRYEKLGIDAKAIKFAYGEAQKDPNEARAQKQRRDEYLVMLGIIEVEPDGQGNFAAGLTVTVAKPSNAAIAGVVCARAHADGYNSGLVGGKIDACKFNPGSEEFVAWRDGWQDGHADRIAKNPDADKVTQAEPRRRGRPPKNNDAVTSAPAEDGIGAAAGNA